MSNFTLGLGQRRRKHGDVDALGREAGEELRDNDQGHDKAKDLMIAFAQAFKFPRLR